MIARIYVKQRKYDSRGTVIDSYTIDSKLNRKSLKKLGTSLANPTLEKFFINKIPVKNFNRAIEIGYLPGVTDNAGHTVKEMAEDLLKKKGIDVYTSKIFLIKGKVRDSQLKKIASSLYNPLIERGEIWEVRSGKLNLPKAIPKVELEERKPVAEINLNIPDEELKRMGKEGILSRGPLALDLLSMKTIRTYFKKLGQIGRAHV